MTDEQSQTKIPELRIGKDRDGCWTVAMADQFGWVEVGTGEPYGGDDRFVADWTPLVAAPPGESVVITQLRRQLEDAESVARLTKAHYIRRCERLTKARDDRQALLDRAATLIEAGKDGGIESWGDQAAEWLDAYRAATEANVEAARLREERAVAEARPHDDEPVLGDVIKCQQCGQQTRSISRGCSVCGLGMARLDEPGKDAGHVWMPYPDEPGRRCTCSIGHDHDEDPDDGPSQAQEVRASADWPAEPVGDRYDELAADRHAEITEAERSEEVHGG